MTDRAVPPLDATTLLAHADRLRALARSLVADGSDADDVVQQTFVAAIEHPPRADLPAGPWLTRVARNFSFRVLRSRRRRALHEAAATQPPPPASPAEAVARTEVLRDVVNAVLALEPIYRDIVIARFFDGLETPKAAARLGIPVETARTRLKRALAMLRERLDRRHGGRAAWLLVLGHRRTRRAASVGAAAGGLLMGKKLAAVAVLLVLGALVWQTTRDTGDRAALSPTSPTETATTAASVHPRTHAAEEQAPAPEPQPPQPAEVPGPKATGRVVDESGRPVVGARVVSMPDDIRETFAADDAGTKAPRTFRAATGPDGRFVVRLDDKAPGAMLVADAPGFSPASRTDVRPGEDLALTLVRTTSLSGRVLDIDGAPVAGATVRVLDLVQAVQVARTARSGDDGAYRVNDVPRREPKGYIAPRWIEVTADGFATLMLEENRFSAAAETRDLVLVRGAKLMGRVLDAETGAPVAGAHVLLWSIEGMQLFGMGSGSGWSNPWGERELGEKLSGDDGAFAFEHVPSEGFHRSASHNAGRSGGLAFGVVGAWKDGWAYATADAPLRPSGSTIEADVKLWPAATIEGRALLADGRPAPEATISATVEGRTGDTYMPTWMRDSTASASWTMTAADGTFALRGVRAARSAPTTVKVEARRKGAAYSMYSQQPDAAATLEVRAGEPVAPVTLTLVDVAVPSIGVRVRDTQGRPIWGANVGLQSYGWTVRSDVDGLATLRFNHLAQPGARAPQETDLVVRARGFGTTSLRATPATNGPEVAVTLQPARRVAGTVRWSDGTPAAGVSVQAVDAAAAVEDAFPSSQITGFGRQQKQGQRAPVFLGTVTVSDDGTFAIEDLPDAPCHVAAITYARAGVSPGMAPKPVRDIRQSVAPGTEDLTFVLPKETAPPTQAVEGAIRDGATGRAVARATIWLVRGGETQTAEMTAPGRFRFGAVPLGTWTLRAAVQGYVTFETTGVEVAAGAAPSPLDIELDRGATAKGVLHVATGTIPDGSTISFRPAASDERGAEYVSGLVRSDGSFDVSGLAPGAYRPSVTYGNTWQTELPPLVPADGRAVTVADAHGSLALDLTLAPAGTLSTSVSDPRLPPMPYTGQSATEEQRAFGAAATLEIRDAAGALVASQKGLAENYAGAAGRLDLLPGTYVVRVTFPGEPPREQRVEVKTCAQARATFKP